MTARLPPAGPRAARPPLRAPGAVTLADVARAAGVSLATASRAVNGSPDRVVGSDLRERVVAAAASLGYSPDANAQAMARGRTASIGLIVHDIADPYFSAIAAGVTQAAGEQGLVVTLASTDHEPERELAFVRTLHNQRHRAIVLVGGRQDDDASNARLRAALDTYRRHGGGVAMVGQPILGVHVVQVDNTGASGALALALLARGYRRFGVLAGPTTNLTARERTAGFSSALADAGIPVDPDAVVAGAFTRDGGYTAMEQLLTRSVQVDVVFAVTDVMALGAVTAARAAGLRVPQDLGVAGFDDIPTLRDVTPPLSTVRIPMREMGRRVTALALRPTADAVVDRVAGEVILRSSTPGAPTPSRS